MPQYFSVLWIYWEVTQSPSVSAAIIAAGRLGSPLYDRVWTSFSLQHVGCNSHAPSLAIDYLLFVKYSM